MVQGVTQANMAVLIDLFALPLGTVPSLDPILMSQRLQKMEDGVRRSDTRLMHKKQSASHGVRRKSTQQET